MSGPIDRDGIPAEELMPGFSGRLIHTDGATLAFWVIAAGAVLPEHSHPNEQVVSMIEGRLELTVDGITHVMGPNDVLVIPPNARHSGRALTEVRVLDVFTPPRADYRGFGVVARV